MRKFPAWLAYTSAVYCVITTTYLFISLILIYYEIMAKDDPLRGFLFVMSLFLLMYHAILSTLNIYLLWEMKNNLIWNEQNYCEFEKEGLEMTTKGTEDEYRKELRVEK